MSITFSKLRYFWIATAALVATSLMPANASAACTSMPASMTCPAVCCCEIAGVGRTDSGNGRTDNG